MSDEKKMVKVVLTKNFYDGLQMHKNGKEMYLPESVVYKKQLVKGEKKLNSCFQLSENFEAPKPMPGPKQRPVQHAVQQAGSDVI